VLSLLESLFYVGVDWAAETHAVCVLDAAGNVKSQFTMAHTADGFTDLLRRLGKLSADPMDVPVAMERPDGRLVDALLEAGYPVVPVSPNAIKTWREGEVLSGTKSDAGDAAAYAEYLRLRAHRLRPAIPFTAETKALSGWSPSGRNSDEPSKSKLSNARTRSRHGAGEVTGAQDLDKFVLANADAPDALALGRSSQTPASSGTLTCTI
jgi:transposase